MSDADSLHMRRAIALARTRLGRTWPNPTVGCVIALDGQVLGEAATAPGGRPHAEEQALEQAGTAARGAAAYLTLEPCGERTSHQASCASRLIAAGVSRVVIACEDPTPYASGQGIERLRSSDVAVEGGLLAEEAHLLSAGFIHRFATGRPLVEAADTPEGFDAAFEPRAGESLDAALRRHGEIGHTRLWTPRGGALAWELSQQGLLAEGRR